MKEKRAPELPYLKPAKAAARECGLAYTSLRAAAFRGELPVVRIGRAWYFDVRDLHDFINARKEIVGSAG